MGKSKEQESAPERESQEAAPSKQDVPQGPPAPSDETPQQQQEQAPGVGEARPGIDLKLDESEATTIEADYFIGTFGITEFLFGFGNLLRDGSRTVKIKNKIVMRAPNAKRVYLVLQQLIERYEEQFGTIIV